MFPGADQMLPAFLLVVPGFGDGLGRAPVNAFAAGAFGKKQAPGPVV
jgi:hypothetical protein